MVDVFCEKNFVENYDDNLIQWANNIPLERLSENSKLELLRYNKRINYKDSSIYVSNIEHLFSRYTENQIRTIFYSPFCGTLYLKSLINYSSKIESPEPLPVLTRMNNLINFMNGDVGTFPEDLFNLSGKMSLGYVNHVNNKSLLTEYSKMFSNCARSLGSSCESGDVFLYVINSSRPIMFSLNNVGNLVECKHKLNRALSKDAKSTLLDYIKDIKNS
jgi:hypothetical protein